MRRVLNLITTLEPAGAQSQLLGTNRYIDETKYEIWIGFLYKRPANLEAGSRSPARILDLSRNGDFDPLVLPKLVRLLRRERIEILHTHLVHAGVVGKLAARLAGLKNVVVTRHYAYEGKERTLLYRLEDRLNRRASKVIAVSQAVRSHILEKRITLPEKIEVVPNGIDLERFDPADIVVPNSQSNQGPVIGSVGRLHPQKGFAGLLRAFQTVRRLHPGARLEIVGEGAERGKLQALATELGLESEVLLLGTLPQTEIPAKLLNWDLFVLPSLWEGFGIALVEAMAMERPVIASRVEGMIELIDEGTTGLLVPPGDPETLATAMLWLLEDRERSAAMGRRARASVVRSFSLERAAARIEAIYDQLS